ncbi:MAG TPA: hypothetical protein DHW63_09810 [Hyphomonadaceae bacterium]|nr:hypothetical protein [Hyphomonadaceae bacterium]
MSSMQAPHAMPLVQATPQMSDACEQWLSVMPSPAYVCDQDGRLLHWNERAVTLWGVAPSPNNDAELFWGPASQMAAGGQLITSHECLIAQAMRAKLGYSNHPVRLRFSSGRIDSFDAHVRPTTDGRGQTTGAICVLTPPSKDQAADRVFLTALDTTERVLAEQMATLAQMGRATANPALGLASLESFSNVKTASSRMRVLQAMLDAVAARQASMSEGILELNRERSERVDATLEAFVGAAHRIRTSLDLILGSGEEIEEIVTAAGENGDVLVAAREINLATRWVLQYTSELQDIAQLEELISKKQIAAFDPTAIAEAVGVRLRLLAPDAIKITKLEAPATADGDVQLIEKCLHYVALTALNNAAGKAVEISVRRGQLNGLQCVLFWIGDKGGGHTLERRAESVSRPSALGVERRGVAADGAGYAVARRLVRCLGGTIEVINTKDQGTIVELKVPLEPSQ